MRVIILGGGFSGVYTALRLEKIAPKGWSITLIDDDNYFLYTPLMTEVLSGAIAPTHTVVPLRQLFKRVRVVRGQIEGIDLEGRTVAVLPGARALTLRLPYDHLVLALGSVRDTRLIPGAEGRVLSFKNLADAIGLRNRIIDRLEAAEAEPDPAVRREMGTFVVIGGGFAGVELAAELDRLIHRLCAYYPAVCPADIRVRVLQMLPWLIPEAGRKGGDYALKLLRRRGVDVRLDTTVRRVTDQGVELNDGERLAAHTIILTTGVAPNPLITELSLPKNPRGRLLTTANLQVQGRLGLWAIGDCACVPSPEGAPYPPTAQHAIREATVLAGNLVAFVQGHPLSPIHYQSLGTMAALGGISGVAYVKGVTITGPLAWLMWRTYYLLRLPLFGRKMRVLSDWLLGILFGPDPVQLPTGQLEQRWEGFRRSA